MTIDSIRAVQAQLSAATTFVAIFGALPAATQPAKKSALRKKFAYLAKIVHPDHVPAGGRKEAEEVFRMLNELRQKAEEALETGTYDKPFSENLSPKAEQDSGSELRSKVATYRLSEDPFRYGDFSVLYRGKMLGGVGGTVIAKIASEPAHNRWLEREAIVLKRFKDAKEKTPLAAIRPFVPELLDTFLLTGEKNTRYRVNVSRFVPELVSIAQIIEAFPAGLEPPQAAWVCRRIIAQVLAASMAGVVHTALIPEHILVDPFKHEPFHIGWGHALDEPSKSGTRVTAVIDRYREYYPPEVFEKKPPTNLADLYMAGKTMIKLLGGDVKKNTLPNTVPEKIARILLRTVEESPARRPQDVREFFDEFTRVVREVWGRVYRPLLMPIH